VEIWMNAQTKEEELSADLVAAMLADVAGADVEPATSARIKARVLERTAAAAQSMPAGRPGFIDVLAGAGWRVLAPGVEMKVLFEDNAARSWMVRLQPGSELPPHEHDEGQEECLVLQGDVWLDDRQYGPGDYQIAQRGTWHGRVRTDGGCLLFLRSQLAGAQAT
jgi:quercetin dioxygenase-like cupin family protein